MSAAENNVEVCIGLGSNIEPASNMPAAIDLLTNRKGIMIEAFSSAWETPAVGTPAPDFINAVIRIRTALSIDELKYLVLREVEAELGRSREFDRSAPRTIDLDILIYNGEVIEPEIWDCAYLAVPLSELLPELVNSTTGETILECAARLAKETRMSPRLDILPGRFITK